MTVLDYDKVLEEVGECGYWQKRLFLLLCFPSALSSMAVFMYEFIAYTPPHRCHVPACDTTFGTYATNHTVFSIPTDHNGQSLCKMYQNHNQLCNIEVRQYIVTQIKFFC
jgi:OCT family organic cation transporter-like MFS transporter 4/5